MSKTVITILLAFVAMAAVVWAASCDPGCLGWFPGFAAATFCGIKIYDINRHEANTTDR